MNKFLNFMILLTLLVSCQSQEVSQKIIQNYEPKKNDSIRIGVGEKDFFPLVQKGYTLMLPEKESLNGVLIFLEDSQYDAKNKSAKQLYQLASKNDFAVLSVSTEIPLDFYFSESSILDAHQQIEKIFTKHQLPNKNIYFLGASLVGHRAMKYIEHVKKQNYDFQLDISGIVICNFTMDWTRKWNQHTRDISIDKIDLWEPKFMNYMLETHLNGTPKSASENFHNFSTYSYFDETSRNIKYYKNYHIRAYIEPAIKYRLAKYVRTLYENNATDIVGFLAELELSGNKNTELIVLQPEKEVNEKYNSQATWDKIDKQELMNWIKKTAKK